MAINSREKGKRGERQFAKLCREQGYNVERTGQYCANTEESSDCRGLDGIHIEVKVGKRILLEDAMNQARRDSKNTGNIPIVAHKRDYCGWKITMDAEDWFKLYREWQSGRVIDG